MSVRGKKERDREQSRVMETKWDPLISRLLQLSKTLGTSALVALLFHPVP